MRRPISHIAVVLLLLAACIDWHAPIVHAAQPSSTPTNSPNIRIVELPRTSITTRDPLPTPVAIDPNQTPYPTPYPTPVAVNPDATPLAAPTEYIAPSAAASVQSPALIWPVGGPITTYYSAAHPAVDIAAPCGTPVVAPADGTVTWAGWRDNGGGLVVDIAIAAGLVSLNHLSGIAAIGPTVQQGQIVGYVGMTGNATGCHVHWSLWDGAWRTPLG